MSSRMSAGDRLRRKLPRTMKTARQWIRQAGRAADTRAVFVVGSQRSGTRLPLQILETAPEIMSFSEGSDPYFDGVLLRPLEQIRGHLERSPFPVVALKPICETHRILELLAAFPQSRGIWIFRHYRDTVNSASVKWRSGVEAVRRLAEGEYERAGWRAGGLTAAKLALVRELYRPDLSLHAANAIMWFLRNDLFFDLGADRRDDVLLMRYEDLVTRPEAGARMFDFIGVPRPADHARDVYATSVSKRPFPAIPDAIREQCDAVERKLLAFYDGHGATPAAAAGSASATA